MGTRVVISLPAIILVASAAALSAANLPIERVPNTTLQLPLEPPAFGYAAERAFGSLTFTNPVAILAPPGETNRLFVVEQDGFVAVVTNLAAPTRTTFLNLSARVSGGAPNDERGLLGMAFHPGYATNRYFFLFYSTSVSGTAHQRISRFQTAADDPNQGLSASELTLISQPDDYGNHNGGDLHFGPDGYLYVTLGDEGAQNDQGNNSQRIDKDFFSGILRIDVDPRPGSVTPNPHPAVQAGTYAVPPDNPWVGATSFNGASVNPASVRAEFWAVGLRNPWRISFDPLTGLLYCGDVGGGLREEVNIITRGGNYGWAYREGTSNGPKSGQAPPGFTSIDPISHYGHGGGPDQGNSITGGVVYRGNRLSQLYGAYVFSDYVSGNVWAIRHDGVTTTARERLLGRGGVAGFGYDPRNGDVLLADQINDTVQRLVYNTDATGTPLPPTLADTGAFADLAALAPEAGIVPYEPNISFWSDHGTKQRWFSVPDLDDVITFNPEANWSFPTGTVWVKHFELQLTNGVPESSRRLETRFIVRNTDGVYGITYRWTDPPTNAVLVPEEGLDEALAINDGGIVRTQVWHYPSRTECLRCHTPVAGWALGFDTAQLNRPFTYAGGAANQIDALHRAGYFAAPVPELYTLPALAPATDETASVEWRVRSWLDANCSQCHQPGGIALGQWDARAGTPLSLTGLINGTLNSDLGDPDNRLVVPGSVEHSMIHTRINRLDDRRMPPLASREIDEASAQLLRRWINDGLAGYQTYDQWSTQWFPGDPTAGQPEADPDDDGASNWLEYLTRTAPDNEIEAWGVDIEQDDTSVLIVFARIANRRFQVQWTEDLTDPESWRPLDVPSNRPIISAETVEAIVEDAPGDALVRFYRVEVFEP